MRQLLQAAVLISALGACTTVSPPPGGPAEEEPPLRGRPLATIEATAPAASPRRPEPDEDVTPASPRSDSALGGPDPSLGHPGTAPPLNAGALTGTRPDASRSPIVESRAGPSSSPLSETGRLGTSPPLGLPAVGPAAEGLCDVGRGNHVAEQHVVDMCEEVLSRAQ